jgi:hypothetical protein
MKAPSKTSRVNRGLTAATRGAKATARQRAVAAAPPRPQVTRAVKFFSGSGEVLAPAITDDHDNGASQK